MILGFFLRIIPYFLLILFIFFEFAPAYFSEKEIIKPYFTFMFLYALINNDSERFRPFWILLVGLFYDFLDGDVIGITSLFFLITLHLLRRKHSTIISVDFRIIWTNFILILFAYIFVNKFVKFILFDEKLRNEIVDYNYEVARHFYSYSVVRSNLRAFIASLTGY